MHTQIPSECFFFGVNPCEAAFFSRSCGILEFSHIYLHLLPFGNLKTALNRVSMRRSLSFPFPTFLHERLTALSPAMGL